MEFFLSGSLPLIDFVICDVMSDMANKLLSLSLYCVKTTQRRIMKSSLYDSPGSVVSNEVILVPLGEEIPLERGHQRGGSPLSSLFYHYWLI